MASQFRPTQVAYPALLGAFPNLRNAKWRIRSPFNDSYQCIAWAACRTDRKWWPVYHSEFYWPPSLPRITPPPFPELWATPVDYLVQGFETLGYKGTTSPDFELGYQKVAVYANETGATHMARQHFLGRGWLSKLGEMEDIVHAKLSDIEGDTGAMSGQYGLVTQVLKRSWWDAIVNSCVFHCVWGALKFWLYRLGHPSWNMRGRNKP